MDGFFTDWAGEDFLDDDEAQVNRNDPMASERDEFSPYEENEIPYGEYDPEEIEAISYHDIDIEDAIDEVDGIFENDVDDPEISGIMPAAGMLGGMIGEELADNQPTQPQRVSLQQMAQETASQKAAGPKVKKAPLRPFEQWVHDVLNGRKDINED